MRHQEVNGQCQSGSHSSVGTVLGPIQKKGSLTGFYSLSPQKSSVPDNPVQLASGVLKRHSYRLEISVVA